MSTGTTADPIAALRAHERICAAELRTRTTWPAARVPLARLASGVIALLGFPPNVFAACTVPFDFIDACGDQPESNGRPDEPETGYTLAAEPEPEPEPEPEHEHRHQLVSNSNPTAKTTTKTKAKFIAKATAAAKAKVKAKANEKKKRTKNANDYALAMALSFA